jgi:sortase A
VLLAVGLILVLVPVGRLAYARIYYELAARGIIVLDSEPALDAGSRPGHLDPNPSPGGTSPDTPQPGGAEGPLPAPAWRIYIPKLRVAWPLVYDVTREALKAGPGVYPQGAKPGEPGNLSIAGHRSTHGAPFWYLDKLVAGDEVLITVGDTAYVYLVEKLFVVEPTDWSAIEPTGYDAITLTTCHPLGSTSRRLIVRGRLERVQEAVPGRSPR